MTSLQLAQEEWEQNTTPHTKLHPIGRGIVHEHEFRQYGHAIAWLNWSGECIEITKFETVKPGEGAATKLIKFLKYLSNKYKVKLWEHATVYPPDSPIPDGKFFSQDELENFYRRHGFRVRKIADDASEIIYP